ncbi:MAG TPA: 50S ribosomal protein L24 [Synergistaceae bacterium]|nr:50S ribosomal protein L24 [Synergistaceae bacterium]HPQ43729.1 50S ribosomal protein L24 [Syntrophales bacterium]
MHIKKNDMVKVIAGREKGKTGKVLKVIREKNRIVIEKTNLIKKHQRPTASGKGGIVEKEAPLHVSNVMLVCSKCNDGVKVGYKVLEDGKKVRICNKCQELLDE